MKALGIAFSARKRGNCLNSILENEKVRERLDNLVKLILKDWKSKQ